MEYLNFNQALGSFLQKLRNKFAPSSHKHTASDISDLPASLPANGGNADTLGGKSASAFAPVSHTHTASEVSGLPTSLPANGGNADTVGGAAVMTTSALGLHRMASGTAEPTSATCPSGCWYGQYE